MLKSPSRRRFYRNACAEDSAGSGVIISLTHPLNMCSQRTQFLVNVLITTFDLSNVTNRGFSISSECSQQHSHTCTNIRAFQIFTVELIRSLDQAAIRV